MQAHATFEIAGWEQQEWDESDSAKLSRARVTKTFSGEADGASVAEVLMAETTAGPAAYAAQERFTGSLNGKRGSFVAQHGATALGTESFWTLVSGSGSGELEGIAGTAILEVEGDQHRITFEYELP